MQTYTLREAAEAAGISYEALRSRVDRGQIRAVRPGRGRERRIPRSELEAAGLNLGDNSASTAEVISDLIKRLETQAMELASLRQLEERTGLLNQQLEAERLAREAIENKLHEMTTWREQVRTASWWRRSKLLKEPSETLLEGS